MATMVLFRGKSATGKTALTNRLARTFIMPVFRKDDGFDPLSPFVADNQANNCASHDVRTRIIQTNIDSGIDFLVGIALPDTPGISLFPSKLKLGGYRIVPFFCGCSDLVLWKKRFDSRLQNPQPNQYFNSFEALIAHYETYEIELLPGERYLDSARNREDLFSAVFPIIEKQVKSSICLAARGRQADKDRGRTASPRPGQ